MNTSKNVSQTKVFFKKALRKGFATALLATTMFVPLGATAHAEDVGFSISVDGEHLAGTEATVDEQRTTDVRLEDVDIQVKFDGLDVRPTLNVSTTDLRRSYTAGEQVEFLATNNYPDWIAAAELRIYERSKTRRKKPLKVLPVSRDGHASWIVPNGTRGAENEYEYVLRVYDEKGRFDETKPLGLKRSAHDFPTHETSEPVVAAGEGEDRTAVRNIPVYGGAVTVYGRNVPDGFRVNALNEGVPLDQENAFVVQRILPPGMHNVQIDVANGAGEGVAFDREINIPRNDWFYVGLADVTLGRRFGDSVLTETAPGEYDDTYSKGRLAFYLKGKIQGRYLLTAAADTGEDELDNLFRGLAEKDPRSILRRIDPDEFYPVYGDDSTSYEDAPTQGKFYVRLERDDNHVMWGNYKTAVKGTYFVRNERALYGAQAVMRSQHTTSQGERVAEVELYASEPDTLPQRDTFRGTGGSAYFLLRQDITRGSETVSIESRDPVTGRVLSRQILQDGEDYRIDYIQGVILLEKPLRSTGSTGELIRDRALGDAALHLVVQYEYTPTISNVDGYSYGGRAQAWLADNIRVGVSGIKEDTGLADNELIGADVHIRLGLNSFIEAEIAQSEGPGFGTTYSNNGGLTILDRPNAGIRGRVAQAFAVKGQVDLNDFNPALNGVVGAYYEERDAGFSSYTFNTPLDERVWGVHADVKQSESISYRLAYEDYTSDNNQFRREGSGELEYRFDSALAVRLGIKHTDLDTGALIGFGSQDGRRTDLGARLTWTPDDDNTFYVFGQKTVERSGSIDRNDRYGLGVEKQITEKIGIRGEVSHGTSGWGGIAGLTYDPTADNHYYVGYELDPERSFAGSGLSGTDLGGLVVGARRRYNDQLAAYVENNYDMFGQRRTLTTTYGVTYTPDAFWTLGGGVEYGALEDPIATDLDRTAVSLSLGYQNSEAMSWKVKGEARFEDSDDFVKDRDTYLLSAALTNTVHDDWRFIAAIDAVISDSDQASFLDGDYVEASIGYAYRPVENDRLNALFKYTHLRDLPGPDQITVNNGAFGPAQRSHVLSADVTYDLNRYWTIGAKYGFRKGEVSADRTASNFTSSTAHLGVLRADFHVVKNWDLFIDGRVLKATELDSVDYGLLAGVYRHVGDNLKVGVGYNFGRFSDDVTDLTYDDGGVFFNVVGKF